MIKYLIYQSLLSQDWLSYANASDMGWEEKVSSSSLLTSYSHLDWLWIINFLVNSDGLYRKDTTSNCNFQLKRKRKKKDSDPLTSSLGGEENWEKESSYLEITVLVEIVRTICISLPAPCCFPMQCKSKGRTFPRDRKCKEDQMASTLLSSSTTFKLLVPYYITK